MRARTVILPLALLALSCLASGCILEKARRDGAACSQSRTCPRGQECSKDGQCLYPCPQAGCSNSECGCGAINRGDSPMNGVGFTCLDGLCHWQCVSQGNGNPATCSGFYMGCDPARNVCLPGCGDDSQCASPATCSGIVSDTGGSGGPSQYCLGTGGTGDGGAPDGGGGCPPYCSGSGVYSVAIDSAGTTIDLWVDTDTDGGGWILVGKVGGRFDMSAGWLRTDYQVGDLQDLAIPQGQWASIDARWLAVNKATMIRFSNQDASRWVKWALPPGRQVDRLWKHEEGQTSIASAPFNSTNVFAWNGTKGTCNQNVYGVLPYIQHGGSYPATYQDPTGTTAGGDLCMAIGVMLPGAAMVDGFTQNGNGFDAPSNDTDWPNSSINVPASVNVWLR